jgi:hypothetical protein
LSVQHFDTEGWLAFRQAVAADYHFAELFRKNSFAISTEAQIFVHSFF